MDTIVAIISSPWVLGLWVIVMIPCLLWTIRDLTTSNSHLMPLMRVVWALTVLYSGPVGLLVYRWAGRKQISADGPARRGARSVAHCYSGCGAGEIAGLTIAVGLFSFGTTWVVVTTFSLAYIFGVALTVGPMVQEGTPFRTAFKDAIIAETPSIFVMELVAIGSDLILAGDAGLGDVRFWGSLIVSLSLGLLAAWPVNILLIRMGVKEGMMDPRHSMG